MPEKTFAFTFPIQVCLRDLDGLGHVNNAVYLTYLETARNRYVFDLAGKKRLHDFDFILAHTSIDFRSSAELHEVIEVALRPSRIGSSSWDIDYELREAKSRRLVVEARSVQVSFNYAAGTSMPVPEEWRRLLTADMVRCDPATNGADDA